MREPDVANYWYRVLSTSKVFDKIRSKNFSFIGFNDLLSKTMLEAHKIYQYEKSNKMNFFADEFKKESK